MEKNYCNTDGCTLLKQLTQRVDTLDSQLNKAEEKINNIDKKMAVSEERIETIFQALNDIKLSIDKIGNKLDNLKVPDVTYLEKRIEILQEKKEEEDKEKLKSIKQFKYAIGLNIAVFLLNLIMNYFVSLK